MDIRKEVQKVWRSLRRRDRRAFRATAKGHPDAGFRLRHVIVLNLVRGTSPTEVSRVLHCSRSQVYRIGHRFIDQGVVGLVDRREDNGEAKVDEGYESVILEAVASSPQEFGWDRPTWTQELLILVCKEKTGIGVSKSTMCRVLQRLPVRLGRPKPYVFCPWRKARRTRRLNEIRRLINRLPKDEVAVFVDEVDIHLNPKIGYDWMLQGIQKQVLTPGKNEKRYLAGALNAKTGKLTWVESDRKTSELFIDQLWTLVQHDYPEAKCVHLILDNYRIHSSNQTKIALKALEGRIKLHFLPPYCPDHNKIERVWQDLHANVTRNHRSRSMKDLMKRVRAYLKRRKTAAKHVYVKATNG